MADDGCACGCGRHAKRGLQPRFADGLCRQRWISQWAIQGPALADAAGDATPLDDSPQEPPAPAGLVSEQEATEVRAEFATRIAVAPQVEAALAPTSGMTVRTPTQSLWKALRRVVRRVSG